jgi:hypothetical protein
MQNRRAITIATILLFCCLSGLGAPIVDTGVPTDMATQWSFHNNSISTVWYAGEFVLQQAYDITDISTYLTPRYAGTVTVALYPASGLPGSAAELFSGTFQGTTGGATDWYGISGLNWSLQQGTYWVAFEARDPQENYYSTLPNNVPSPLPGYAFYNRSAGGWQEWNVPGQNFGVRISGVAAAPTDGAVPEPATAWLLGAGAVVFAALKRRRR